MDTITPNLFADTLGTEDLAQILEQGSFDDWVPLLHRIYEDPDGVIADAALSLCAQPPYADFAHAQLLSTLILGARQLVGVPSAIS